MSSSRQRPPATKQNSTHRLPALAHTPRRPGTGSMPSFGYEHSAVRTRARGSAVMAARTAEGACAKAARDRARQHEKRITHDCAQDGPGACAADGHGRPAMCRIGSAAAGRRQARCTVGRRAAISSGLVRRGRGSGALHAERDSRTRCAMSRGRPASCGARDVADRVGRRGGRSDARKLRGAPNVRKRRGRRGVRTMCE